MEAFVDFAHGVRRGGAQRHSRPQLHAGLARPAAQNLYDVVALAERRGFPVVAGTEMNAPGQKFVDAFSPRRS